MLEVPRVVDVIEVTTAAAEEVIRIDVLLFCQSPGYSRVLPDLPVPVTGSSSTYYSLVFGTRVLGYPTCQPQRRRGDKTRPES